ncbi:DUF6470 family protein [Sporolactobacillus inulinus]|uniref:Uncharacterized protein n=1 Tax=Sporolactobacillus inulinus CASD TaxID=1069536 RepID=A0A0U1QRJ2_9BACL|nr:DUF6470 family protein [Sporolactobacillus inulinus]KLI03434.1 hypothetical protein SINU_02820 [Sporolactobacillus inulinus CASD]GEB77200.1 hypothetical protein SIN01_15450 [Sporolactobacillus inulinus]
MTKILPHLEMHQQFGKIAIHSERANLALHQSPAEQSIQQPKAKMSLERTPAQVTIDQSNGWHNLDLKSARVRIAEAADAGRQAVRDGIMRRAQEGDELLHIERSKGKNLIAKQAADHAHNAVIGTHYQTGNTPASEAVHCEVSPARLQVDWQTHAPILSAVPHAPEASFQPGQAVTSMAQYPSLEIQAVGIFVDEKG